MRKSRIDSSLTVSKCEPMISENIRENPGIKKRKTTAPRIPAWSPTVVLTGRHPG